MRQEINITREWAMPNKWTFLIPPIKKLICKYIGDGTGWIDPFAGENSPAEITNDLNPERPAKHHLHANDFCLQLSGEYKGVLFDPPYSPRQTKECYDNIGLYFGKDDSERCVHWGAIKSNISEKIITGGHALSFGWSTTGFGKKRGFHIVEILIVNYGGNGHYDTLCTVEKKL